MEYIVEKLIDGKWYVEGRGPIQYANRVIDNYSKLQISIRLREIQKTKVAGYEGIFSNEGIYVPIEDAYDYARDNLDSMSENNKKEFVEFFFSGNWIGKDI